MILGFDFGLKDTILFLQMIKSSQSLLYPLEKLIVLLTDFSSTHSQVLTFLLDVVTLRQDTIAAYFIKSHLLRVDLFYFLQLSSQNSLAFFSTVSQGVDYLYYCLIQQLIQTKSNRFNILLLFLFILFLHLRVRGPQFVLILSVWSEVGLFTLTIPKISSLILTLVIHQQMRINVQRYQQQIAYFQVSFNF